FKDSASRRNRGSAAPTKTFPSHLPWRSRQLGGQPGSDFASNTPRATARASVFAAIAPSSVISLTASASRRRPVAAANTVSPSSVTAEAEPTPPLRLIVVAPNPAPAVPSGKLLPARVAAL